MNWEAIGAVGEVGGAIGVVATLVYLAVQVRQNSDNLQHNSESVRAATELENARLAAEWNSEVAREPALAEIFLAASSGELTREQALRFRFLMASLFYRFEGLYRQNERGLLSDEAWRAWEKVILNMLSFPEVKQWWTDVMHPFSDSFRTHVDRLIAERGAHPDTAPQQVVQP